MDDFEFSQHRADSGDSVVEPIKTPNDIVKEIKQCLAKKPRHKIPTDSDEMGLRNINYDELKTLRYDHMIKLHESVSNSNSFWKDERKMKEFKTMLHGLEESVFGKRNERNDAQKAAYDKYKANLFDVLAVFPKNPTYLNDQDLETLQQHAFQMGKLFSFWSVYLETIHIRKFKDNLYLALASKTKSEEPVSGEAPRQTLTGLKKQKADIKKNVAELAKTYEIQKRQASATRKMTRYDFNNKSYKNKDLQQIHSINLKLIHEEMEKLKNASENVKAIAKSWKELIPQRPISIPSEVSFDNLALVCIKSNTAGIRSEIVEVTLNNSHPIMNFESYVVPKLPENQRGDRAWGSVYQTRFKYSAHPLLKDLGNNRMKRIKGLKLARNQMAIWGKPSYTETYNIDGLAKPTAGEIFQFEISSSDSDGSTTEHANDLLTLGKRTNDSDEEEYDSDGYQNNSSTGSKRMRMYE